MSLEAGPLGESTPLSNSGQARKRTQRSRPGRSLPTDRMKFEAQQRVLGAYATLSGADKKIVTAERVSQFLKGELSHYTVTLSNGFFVDAGWLEKRRRGEFAASDALLDYNRRRNLNRDDIIRSVRPLREAALDSWFWRSIRSQLEFSTPEENDLLLVLMSDAEASPEHIPQLRNLLEWVEFVGLIRRVDGLVHLGDSAAAPRVDGADVAPPTESSPLPVPEERPEMNAHMPSVAQVQQSTPEPVSTEPPALMAFEFSCRVTAEDLAKLSPEQIQAVFAAVGTLMSLNVK